MKLSVQISGERKTYHLDIRKIYHQFMIIEDPVEQVNFIERKMAELTQLSSIGKKNLDLVSRLKRDYLLQFRHLDLILNGLLKMAESELDAISRHD